MKCRALQFRPERGGDRPAQRLDADLGRGGQPHARTRRAGIALGVRRQPDSIDLVEHLDLRNLAGADRGQHLVHLLDALETLWIAGIDHVQQQARIARFLERGTKCRDQLVRQIAHESHRVREHRDLRARQLDAAHRRVERREQLVGDVRARHRSSALKSVDLPALV